MRLSNNKQKHTSPKTIFHQFTGYDSLQVIKLELNILHPECRP